ncbi:MAG: protein-tyrosine-phosphatase [Leadbetterella sp.]
MVPEIAQIIEKFDFDSIEESRKSDLNALANFIKNKVDRNEQIRLNFICTHNSRRSHLSQIWAQTLAYHFGVKDVFCYSGGTEATAMFPKIAETLVKQGFEIMQLSHESNPVYAVKYAENEPSIICFSKAYDHVFNPKEQFVAIMTCNNADIGCPIVVGSEARFPIKFEDPKAFDGTDLMDVKYAERSLQIGEELAYVFRMVGHL